MSQSTREPLACDSSPNPQVVATETACPLIKMWTPWIDRSPTESEVITGALPISMSQPGKALCNFVKSISLGRELLAVTDNRSRPVQPRVATPCSKACVRTE